MTEFFKFDKIDLPQSNEVVNKKLNYYEYGKNNNYPNFLIDLYKESSNHSSMVDNIITRVVGSGFQSDNERDKQLIEKYKVNEWFNHAARQLQIFGAFSTEIIWTPLHEYINTFNSINIDRIRIGLLDDETEEPTLFYYSTKFGDYKYLGRNKDLDVLYKFDPDPKSDNHQLLYNFGLNRIGNDIYGRPDYNSGIPWIKTDIELPKYYMNLVHNNFMVSNILYVPFQPNENEREKFENSIKKQFTGSENAASVMVIYGNGDSEIKLLNVTGDHGEKKYDELINLTCESIARNLRIPSPILAGISLPGNLFGISDLPTLEQMLNKQVIYPKRNLLLNEFNKINKHLREPIQNFNITDVNIFNEKTN